MITIIHGEDSFGSRMELRRRKEVAVTVVELPASATFNQIAQNTGGQEFFGAQTQKLLVIEGFFKKILAKEVLDYLLKNYQAINLLLYEDKKTKAMTLKPFVSKAEILEFKGDLIWKFLDTLKPGGTKEAVLLGRKLLLQIGSDPWEMSGLVSLLKGHFNDIKEIKTTGKINKKIHPFRLTKLTTATKLFNLQHLGEINEAILDFKLAIKFNPPIMACEPPTINYTHNLKYNFEALILKICDII